MMDNRGVSIRYGDVAPEAKENFEPWSNNNKFDTLSQLKEYNLTYENFANPCELYQTVLDGTASAFPSEIDNVNLGLWSTQLSGNDGKFTTPIVLELTSNNLYSSQGITLTFDTVNQIYCNELFISWYRDNTLLWGEKFNPDNAFYFCSRKVENYNRIVIEFYSINMPYNRLKLQVIDYGYGTFFYGNELRNVNIIQEIDPVSTQISINTVDFTLDSKRDVDYSFQAKQPLSVYFDGDLKASAFVKSSKRQSKNIWKIQGEDYIGIMDGVSFVGDIYEGKDAYELLEEIFNVSKVPYVIDESLREVLLWGYIPYTTCRDALMQVVFACQYVVDTSGSENVKVFELDNNIQQTIPLNRIMQGQSFDNEETVTGVEVVSHTYRKSRETVDLFEADNVTYGNDITIMFSEPIWDLQIGKYDSDDIFVNDSNLGSIVESGTNYAIINAVEGCVLRGKKYIHTTTPHNKKLSVISAGTYDKVIAIEKGTLVSKNNIKNVLNKCFEWLTKNNSTNLKIVEGKSQTPGNAPKYGYAKYGQAKYGISTDAMINDKKINTGDFIKAETEYLGIVSGRIIKQKYNLNGNIIVKDAVLK